MADFRAVKRKCVSGLRTGTAGARLFYPDETIYLHPLLVICQKVVDVILRQKSSETFNLTVSKLTPPSRFLVIPRVGRGKQNSSISA